MIVNPVSSISTAAEPSDAPSAAAHARCIGALWRLGIWMPDCGTDCPRDEGARPFMPHRQEVHD
jgi:hypothetical protein